MTLTEQRELTDNLYTLYCKETTKENLENWLKAANELDQAEDRNMGKVCTIKNLMECNECSFSKYCREVIL